MGLDMYLKRAPRFEDITAKGIEAIEGYFSWKEAKAQGDDYAKCTLKKWCGVDYKDVPKRAIKFYAPYHTTKYSAWDTEHKYGHTALWEGVGYWRKANAIHRWFVDNVQGGEDDCDIYEVSKEQIEELLDICERIKSETILEKGWVKNGETFANGMWCPNYEEGETIVNPEVAEELLPTQGGFFFGSIEYDQYYMDDINETIDILTKVLETTDFDTQMIAYCASW